MEPSSCYVNLNNAVSETYQVVLMQLKPGQFERFQIYLLNCDGVEEWQDKLIKAVKDRAAGESYILIVCKVNKTCNERVDILVYDIIFL